MAELVRKRRPIAGALWGISLGLGLALLAINSKIISLSIPSIAMVVVLGIIIGIVWGMFGPAKKPKGAAARGATPPEPPAVEPEPSPDPEPPSASEPPSTDTLLDTGDENT
jgi:hypothetical protein